VAAKREYHFSDFY